MVRGRVIPNDQYQPMEKVGEGTFGIVYKARNVTTGDIVAIKQIRLFNEVDGVPATALREISLLKEINSRYVIRLRDVVHGDRNLQLVFDFVDMDLRQFLRQRSVPPPIDMVRMLAQQIVSGTAACHERGVAHRDLKPQNILVDRGSLVLKLADFGLSRALGQPIQRSTREVVTLWYRAPELLLGLKTYSFSLDMWSVGCIIAELSNGKPLFDGDSEVGQLMRIFCAMGTPNEDTWPGCTMLPDFQHAFPRWPAPQSVRHLVPNLDDNGCDLVKRMLAYNPTERITAAEALRHPFFTGTTSTKGELIVEDYSVGPLSVLSTSMKAHLPVLIACRNNRKLLGRIKAFDRHCNMILENVKEMWSEGGRKGKGKKKSEPQNHERHISKMFLRGDSVIMVMKNPIAVASSLSESGASTGTGTGAAAAAAAAAASSS